MLLDTYIKYIEKEIATSGIALLAMKPLKTFPPRNIQAQKKETPKGLLNFSRIS